MLAIVRPGFANDLFDGAENEVSAFCFTIHDPTNGQPGKPKLSSEIGAMLANVRPNCRLSGC
jgi:hypothetical protein